MQDKVLNERRNLKFREFLNCFEHEEEALNFFLDKYRLTSQTSRKLALQKTLYRFSLSNSPFSSSYSSPISKVTNSKVAKELFPKSNNRKEMKYSFCQFQGQRQTMEDRYVIREKENLSFFGIFDGHYGDSAAIFCADRFFEVFETYYEEHKNSPKKALELTFDHVIFYLEN